MNRAVLLIVLAACGGKAAPAADDDPIACSGERIVTGQDDLVELGHCESVDGDVTIRGASSLDFRAIDSLEVVGGQLTIGPTFDVDTINLEFLREVGSLRVVSNGVAGGVYLPRLERAGMIEIAANLGIAQIAMPGLEEVKSELIIEQNPALEIVDLGTLEEVGGMLQLRNNGVLHIVEIGELQHVGGLDLTGSAIAPDHSLWKFAKDQAMEPD